MVMLLKVGNKDVQMRAKHEIFFFKRECVNLVDPIFKTKKTTIFEYHTQELL